MGHHLDKPSTSALTYGWQNFIPILVKVAVLLKRIVSGNFSPDAQPSRIVRQALLAMEEESNGYLSQMGLPVEVAESEDSADDVEDHEDLELAVGHLVPADERRLVQLSQAENFEQHRLSGVAHLVVDDSKFACGRNRTANYLSAEPDFTRGVHILCDQCKASAAFSREPVP